MNAAMSRWIGLIACAVFGVVVLLCGLLIPAHLRAVDALTLQKAGRGTPSPVEKGMLPVKHNPLADQIISSTSV